MKKYFIYIVIIPFLVICYFITYKKDLKSEIIENNESMINLKSDTSEVVKLKYNDEIIEMTLENYLIGVLSCEMPALFHSEALKAGAVAARTYYYNKKIHTKDYIADNNEQCFINKEEMKQKWDNDFDLYYSYIKEAVDTTSDEVILYNDEVINAYYFSISNGKTEECSKVFGYDYPYLISTDSSWDIDNKNYKKELILTTSEFKDKLNIIENEIKINDIIRNESGRVDKIIINNKDYTGVSFRKLFNLRSTDFDIYLDKENIKIITRGYGHGVGMSQYGANEMAKMGYSFKDILKHYYHDVEIDKF